MPSFLLYLSVFLLLHYVIQLDLSPQSNSPLSPLETVEKNQLSVISTGHPMVTINPELRSTLEASNDDWDKNGMKAVEVLHSAGIHLGIQLIMKKKHTQRKNLIQSNIDIINEWVNVEWVKIPKIETMIQHLLSRLLDSSQLYTLYLTRCTRW